MKKESFGYTQDEVNKIISVITAMVESATLLDSPVKWTDTPAAHYTSPGGKDRVHEALLEDDSGRKIEVWIYYAPITAIEFSLDCNHKIGFNTVEGMLRVYWRLTGQKFPGTEDFKGVYWLKTAMK